MVRTWNLAHGYGTRVTMDQSIPQQWCGLLLVAAQTSTGDGRLWCSLHDRATQSPTRQITLLSTVLHHAVRLWIVESPRQWLHLSLPVIFYNPAY
jgi:hypothetical protein